MTQKIIRFVIILITLGLVIEGAIFILLAYNIGLLPTIFAYFAKSIIGWTCFYYLQPTSGYQNQVGRFQTILQQEETWRKKATLIAVSMTLPGILPTIIALIFTLYTKLRNALILYLSKQFEKSLFSNISNMANPYSRDSIFDPGDKSNTDESHHSNAHDDNAAYQDVYETSSNEVWQTVTKKSSRTKKDEKDEPLIVDIPS